MAPLRSSGSPEAFAWYRAIYYPTYQRLDGFVAGVSLAAAMTFAPRVRAFAATYSHALFAAALLILGLTWTLTSDSSSLGASVAEFPILALAYGLMVASSLSPASLLARIPSWLASPIAKLSFAIYLIHKGVIHLVQDAITAHGGNADGTLTAGICLLASLAAAALMHVLIERPALALSRRLTLRQP